MINNKVSVHKKQLTLPGVTPMEDSSVLLAEAILDIVAWACSEDHDVEELVNNVKPKAEAVLRQR